MARKKLLERFKLTLLNPEEQRAINEFSGKFNPEDREKFLKSIQERGDLSGELRSGLSFRQFADNPEQLAGIESIVSKLPQVPLEKELRKFGDITGKDISQLSTEELEDLLESQQEIARIGTTSEKKQEFLKSAHKELSDILTTAINQTIAPGVAPLNPNDNSIVRIANAIQTGAITTQKELEDFLISEKVPVPIHKPKTTAQQIVSNMNRHAEGRDFSFYRGEKPFAETKETEIKLISDILGARQASALKESEIEDFLTKFPEELAGSREQFLGGERERALEEFGLAIPRIKESLNVSGRLFGGGLPTALGQAAFDISGELEAMQLGLEQEDLQLYFDAAYRNQLRKSLESREDYRQAIEEERGKAFTERGNTFKQYQSALDRQLKESLRTQDYERALQTQRSRLQREQGERREREQAQLFSGIARSGATIAGAYLGGPAGATVGANIPTEI